MPFFDSVDVAGDDLLDSFRAVRPASTLSTFLGYSHFPVLSTFRRGARSISRKGFLIGSSPSGRKRFSHDEFLARVRDLRVELAVSPWLPLTHVRASARASGDNPRGFTRDRLLKSAFQVIQPETETVVGCRVGDVFGADLLENPEFVTAEEQLGLITKCLDETVSSSGEQQGEGKPQDASSRGLRVVCSSGHPLDVLDWILAGVDLVGGDYPFRLAKLGFWSCFPIRDPETLREPDDQDGDVEMISPFEVPYQSFWKCNLNSQNYARDFGPLVDGCECLTCREHTRAYVHHLLRCHELTASVLLTLHNVHHYLRFFQAIRKAILGGVLREYRQMYMKMKV